MSNENIYDLKVDIGRDNKHLSPKGLHLLINNVDANVRVARSYRTTLARAHVLLAQRRLPGRDHAVVHLLRVLALLLVLGHDAGELIHGVLHLLAKTESDLLRNLLNLLVRLNFSQNAFK